MHQKTLQQSDQILKLINLKLHICINNSGKNNYFQKPWQQNKHFYQREINVVYDSTNDSIRIY